MNALPRSPKRGIVDLLTRRSALDRGRPTTIPSTMTTIVGTLVVILFWTMAWAIASNMGDSAARVAETEAAR